MKNFKDVVTQQIPKILCVGKNYVKHVNEMGQSNAPSEPIFFLKPWSSLTYNPKSVSLPRAKNYRIDHEVQLGVYFIKGGKNIKPEDVEKHIGGYFLGIDFSDRDFQKIAKQGALPWTISKGQDDFCPVSQIFTDVDPYKLQLELYVNGKLRQKDFTSEMHFKIDALVSYISQYMTINEGDLILTGTPMGVGPVLQGDHIQACIKLDEKKLAVLDFMIQKEP